MTNSIEHLPDDPQERRAVIGAAALALFHSPLRPKPRPPGIMRCAGYVVGGFDQLTIDAFTLPDGQRVEKTALDVDSFDVWHGTNQWQPKPYTEIELYTLAGRPLATVAVRPGEGEDTMNGGQVVIRRQRYNGNEYLAQYGGSLVLPFGMDAHDPAVISTFSRLGGHAGAVVLGVHNFLGTQIANKPSASQP